MSYISRNLESAERVLARAQYHWWVNLRSLGFLNMFDHLWIPDQRILHKVVVLSARTPSIRLVLLESKDVEQSLWDRFFGFGDILLHGSGDMTMRFRNIADPLDISRAIRRSVAYRRNNGVRQHGALAKWPRGALAQSGAGQIRAGAGPKVSRHQGHEGHA